VRQGRVLAFLSALVILSKRKEATIMKYTNVALKDKILEMYPEIAEHGLFAGLDFDDQKNAYIITFKRDRSVLTTHLEKKDADDCMNGIKCVYLGIQVAQFIRNFDEREAFGRKVA
jgi:hypothetical protein